MLRRVDFHLKALEILLLLLPITFPLFLAHPALPCVTDHIHVQYQYYQPGHFIIGAITSQLFSPSLTPLYFKEKPNESYSDEYAAVPKNYQHALSLAFAVKEINENTKILPNITLGFQIYDSYFSARMTYQNTLNLLSRHKKTVPNYKCGVEKNLVAVIGGLDSEISSYMDSILSCYKIPQVTYSAAAGAKQHLSSLYQMAPNEAEQYSGIVQLLQYFQWMWVGIFVTADNKGEMFVKTLTHQLSSSEICTASIERLPSASQFVRIYEVLEKVHEVVISLGKTNVNVFVVNADTYTMKVLQWMLIAGVMYGVRPINKVWVMTSDWDFSSETFHRDLDYQNFHGALSFAIHSSEVKGFRHFLLNLNPHSEADGFIRFFWQQAFSCQFLAEATEEDSCTGEEKLESLPGAFFEMQMTSQSYSIYNSVYAVAHALHDKFSSTAKNGGMVL